MKYYVYILKSTVKLRYYIGCTGNLKTRIDQHNAGHSKSTSPYKPWIIIYSEEYSTIQEAMKREWYLKHPRGYLEKLSIIRKYGEVA